jgi:EVE domain
MDQSSATWIFQANPRKSKIFKSLEVETHELWSCRQHANRIKDGDRVFIWISGKESGIYAIGRVNGQPSLRPDTPIGMDYWANPLDGLVSEMRVWVQYERRLLDAPLLREYLRCDPRLWELKILKQPLGTNFQVTDDESDAFDVWLNQ